MFKFLQFKENKGALTGTHPLYDIKASLKKKKKRIQSD